MSKFKYNDRVIVVKDDEDGFFIGLVGIVTDMVKFQSGVVYTVYDEKERHAPLNLREEQLEKVIEENE